MQISVQHVNAATNNDTVSHLVEVYCIKMQPENDKDKSFRTFPLFYCPQCMIVFNKALEMTVTSSSDHRDDRFNSIVMSLAEIPGYNKYNLDRYDHLYRVSSDIKSNSF